MPLSTIAKSLHGEDHLHVKSLKFRNLQDSLENKSGDRIKVILVFVTLIIAVVSTAIAAINNWIQ